ncbi:hypothetical protein [Halopelagius fulvigenes]|uniref:Cox cluster protein n=1 Tax=Halopelagius fulvigenes TaxID=1198324 RepID=A0ABD5U3W7_9EURY
MTPSNPLIDPETGDIDLERLYYEARPIAELMVLLAGVALVPFAAAFAVTSSLIGPLLAVLGQFVLAVGAGVVLLYVVSRAIQLARESNHEDAEESNSDDVEETNSDDVEETNNDDVEETNNDDADE